MNKFIWKIKNFKFRRLVPEAGILPRGYGVAYFSLSSCYSICYPIPFNIFVRLWRAIYYRLIAPHRYIKDALEESYRDGYSKGLSDYLKATSSEEKRSEK